jgi:TPR repeat protein
MPGLKQLKQFSQDVTALGNESSIRAERGEPFVTVPIPSDVPDIDDSDDFLLGLPLEDEENSLHPEAVIPGDQAESSVPLESSASDSDFPEPEYDPEISKLLGLVQDDIVLPEVEPDLDAFGDLDDSSLSEENSGETQPFNIESIPDVESESDEADFNILSELETLEEAFGSEPDSVSALPDDDFQMPPVIENDEPRFDSSDISEMSQIPDIPEMSESFDIPAQTEQVEDFEDLPSLEDAEELSPLEELEEDFSLPNQTDAFSNPPSEAVSKSSEDESFDLDGIQIEDFIPSQDVPSASTPDSNNTSEDLLSDLASFIDDSTPETDFSMPEPPSFEAPEPSSNDDFEGFAPLDLGGAEFDNMPPPSINDGLSEENQFESTTDGSEPVKEKDSIIDSLENFDIDNLSSPSSLSSLDDFQTTDGILAGSDDDEGSSDDYSIPGFSDFNLQDDFSTPAAETAQKQVESQGKAREALREEEYKTFKENLKEYPLNLKMAIEEVIVKNEFTDDAVFGLIEKILQRNTARQVASFMSKYLDISVDVPRDFERRSVSQYEAYKQSIEYQLKNRIIPAFVVAVSSIAVIWTLVFLTNKFIYRPLMAEKLYKEGYELLHESMYPQAELTFAEAVSYKPKKKWFFSYARAYREKYQYDRSRTMYERILSRFKNDKTAGIEYANMELYDLANYEFAEEIVKRKILDHHINDKDAMLLLGDVYLEWATERDSERFPDAFNQYMDLIGLYGSNDEYTKRLLRYYIRTDNLREVLPLKTYFLSKKKSLESSDLVELSAFMLDKLYGDLPPKDEYLRAYIEDVRLLLEEAIKSDPSVPEAHYNFARYFLETGNRTSAKSLLETAISRFDEAKIRKQKRIYKHIDSYRLLGELYMEEQEYILSEETLGQGIMLYEKEAQLSSLQSVPDIGKIYANIGDIDYFIAGDLNQARRNYEKAVENKYDTASVRYRIGYIQYTNKNYLEALGSFIKSASEKYDDRNILLSLGNTLSMRGDNFAAQGYYERLIDMLDLERSRLGILLPQVRSDQGELVDLYMKASNNLGVTLSRLSQRTGDSSLNAKAMVQLSESLRAWDALTRNQETMIRLEGSNLAAQNIKYLTSPVSVFEPAIYSAIPRVLHGEKMLEQSFIKD